MHFRSLALALWLAVPAPVAFLPGHLLATAQAQQKQAITLADIWARPTFQQASVPGFDWLRDGRYYAALGRDGSLMQYSATTGQPTATLVAASALQVAGRPLTVDGYRFNADEQKVLFSTDTEPIYRHSAKATYYLYDRQTQQLSPLSTGGKQGYATFSPDGRQVAFTRDNNLFVKNLASGQETAVTTNGVHNQLINGSADWVYEEEFGFAQGFFWSPDSRHLAYYTFDESQVPEYDMQEWGGLYPTEYRFKYPKAGEKNSVVSVSTYDVASARTVRMDVGPEPDQYLPRVQWTAVPGTLSIQRLNRLQNKLEILHADASTGKTQVVLTDTNAAYVEINDDLKYLAGGKQFLFTSEKDGYQHLYLHDMSGRQVRQLTTGNWEISAVNGFDPKTGYVYYTSTEGSALQRHLYRINLSGKGKQRLSDAGGGTDVVNMSPDTRYFLNTHSSAGVPAVASLREGATGKLVKTLADNAKLRQTLAQYDLGKFEFFTFKTSEGVELNAWMLKPSNFDPAKKYPVLMHVYGGPSFGTISTQTVLDNANGGTSFQNYLWHNMLTEQGYLVVSVENRGTSGRGAAFRKATYANLGKLETIDQGEGAKYLATLPYVDKARIGIWGWSYGGYMTSLAMTKNADLFKMGIAVAPVTNWRYYDTVYTERFLKTPQQNPAGYDDNSPVRFAQNLKGKFLLVHGTGDDNVHFQNSIAFVDALILANKDFQTLYYPNRNHGINGGNTRLHLYRQMTEFIKANL
ncbi:prolyl oligopeptidase family serine peptidase [Hymenobacter sp. HMF4947]|uniref:Prolyl oligopeptidase family serine peptidase n=1 Tax=Hymenobacter ginkgonis TaxID=2682976 RepID=A0A7K1TDN5_9BACT|nr:S9 family peptidase [Hymenobacter ginkgonis]MVN76508.1 prolyl oligopeptidase family serine peptidase [Hymenobacter ginkgonis]